MTKHFAMFLAVFIGASALADTPGDLVRSAAEALREGRHDEAILLYEKAREAMPRSAEIPYNLGVAHYRRGDYEKAAEAFRQAMSLANDGPLRSHATYNMGNAAYAQSLKSLQEQRADAQPQTQLNEATRLLREALDSYKRALDANPRDDDARANAELSHQFLKHLQQLQEQMQQQQPQQGESQDQDHSQDQQEQPQQQQQQQQQQSGESNEENQPQQTSPDAQTQAPDQQSAEQRPQDQPASDEDQPPQDQSAQAQPSAEQEEPEQPPPTEQGDRVRPPDQSNQERTMSREEAERLLQLVRDKERQRRAELARREAAKFAPVEKDW